jgi:hypothetical protein
LLRHREGVGDKADPPHHNTPNQAQPPQQYTPLKPSKNNLTTPRTPATLRPRLSSSSLGLTSKGGSILRTHPAEGSTLLTHTTARVEENITTAISSSAAGTEDGCGGYGPDNNPQEIMGESSNTVSPSLSNHRDKMKAPGTNKLGERIGRGPEAEIRGVGKRIIREGGPLGPPLEPTPPAMPQIQATHNQGRFINIYYHHTQPFNQVH